MGICFAYAPPFFACAAGPEFLRGVGELCDAQPQPRTTASGRQVAPAIRFADLPSTTEHNRILRSSPEAANAGGARVCERGKFAPSTIRSKFAPFTRRGIDAPHAHIRGCGSHIRNNKSHVR